MSEGRGGSRLSVLTAVLGLAALGCVLLYALRVAVSGRIWYLYLVFNLALAAVPYVVAVAGTAVLRRLGRQKARALVALPVAALWLLFYPNAPYILTDFIHVVERTYLRAVPEDALRVNALLWYDLLMTAAFAFIGHFMGLVSMWFIHDSLRRVWGKTAAACLILAASLLAGFGIYLGRFSRLNSWDALLHPRRVLGEVVGAAADLKTLLFSLAFMLFIVSSYAALVVFKRVRGPGEGLKESCDGARGKVPSESLYGRLSSRYHRSGRKT